MNKKITAKQLTSAAACFIFASTLLTKHYFIFGKNDTWIFAILGFAASLPIIFMYSALAKRFPGKSLIEINDAVFGRIVGKVISVLYIFFFLTHFAFYINDVGEFVNSYILADTPKVLIMFIFVFICAWAARKGAAGFVRLSAAFNIMTILAVVATIALLAKDMKLGNLLPVLHQPVGNCLMGIEIMVTIPYCEIFIFFMLAPDMQEPEKMGKSLFSGLMIGALIMLLVILRDTLVLGKMIAVSDSPSIAALRQINIGEIITRFEIFYEFLLLALLFFSASVYYYAITAGLARLFKFDSYRFFINMVGILVLVYALSVFTNVYEHYEWTASGVEVFFPAFFIIFLPLLTMLAAFIRGFRRNLKKP